MFLLRSASARLAPFFDTRARSRRERARPKGLSPDRTTRRRPIWDPAPRNVGAGSATPPPSIRPRQDVRGLSIVLFMGQLDHGRSHCPNPMPVSSRSPGRCRRSGPDGSGQGSDAGKNRSAFSWVEGWWSMITKGSGCRDRRASTGVCPPRQDLARHVDDDLVGTCHSRPSKPGQQRPTDRTIR